MNIWNANECMLYKDIDSYLTVLYNNSDSFFAPLKGNNKLEFELLFEPSKIVIRYIIWKAYNIINVIIIEKEEQNDILNNTQF